MKRIVSFMLALLVIMSVSMTDIYAMSKNPKGLPPGIAKKGYLPPGIAKKFKDIDDYDWAEKAIEKMAIKGVIKGYGEGTYEPKRSVTKLEAIIMALRVMGYEDVAKINLEKIKGGKKKLKNKDRIQSWAYGYVDVALEKGILDEVDLIDMNLNEPAKRHEVAKYIIRALGYEKEAQKYMKKELRFIDAGAIPLGSVGYVYLADKKGIITGYPDKTFRPNRPVTRAEMAVLIARLDDKVDNDIDENEELAEIVKIRGNKLVLKNDNKNKEYRILENTPVYTDDGKYVSVNELEIGMKIKIQLNDKGIIIFIEIKEYEDENIIKQYRGKVEAIDNDYEWIEIEIGSRDRKFDIINKTKVVFEDDIEGDIEDIKIGDKVYAKVNEDNEVVYIKVDRELHDEYKGEVEDIDDDYDWIEIKIGSRDRRFEITNKTEVVFEDDVEGDIEDVKVGDEVKVKANEDKEAVYIEVDRELCDEYKGEIEDIDDDYDWIEIQIGSRDKRFDMTDETKVVFEDDVEGDIEDVKVGDEVKVRINEDDEVEYIEVDRELDYDVYEGLLIEVDDEEVSVLSSKRIISFDVDSDVKVEFKDREGDLEDLMVGDEVKLIIDEDDEVQNIKVDRKYNAVGIAGKLINVYEDARQIVIKQDTKVKIYDYRSTTDVYVNDDSAKISDLEEDDNILLILDDGRVKEIRAYRLIVVD